MCKNFNFEVVGRVYFMTTQTLLRCWHLAAFESHAPISTDALFCFFRSAWVTLC